MKGFETFRAKLFEDDALTFFHVAWRPDRPEAWEGHTLEMRVRKADGYEVYVSWNQKQVAKYASQELREKFEASVLGRLQATPLRERKPRRAEPTAHRPGVPRGRVAP